MKKFSINKISTYLFILGYAFLVFSRFFSKLSIISSNQTLFDIISCVALLLTIIIQSKSYSKKSTLIILILIFLSATITITTRDFSVAKFILVISAAKNLNFNKFIKADMIIRSLLLISVILSYHLGFIESELITRGDLIRNSLGFSHPNYLGMELLLLCFEFLYVNNFKFNIINIAAPIIIALFLDNIADSRTSEVILLSSITFIIGYRFFKGKVLNNKIVKTLIISLPILLSILAFTTFYLYQNHTNLGILINQLLSRRLYYASLYFQLFSFNLFGNDFSMVIDRFPVDIAYFHIPLHFGIIIAVILLLSFSHLLRKLYQAGNYQLIFIVVYLLLLGLTENSFLRIENNAFMLLFAGLIWNWNFKPKELPHVQPQK